MKTRPTKLFSMKNMWCFSKGAPQKNKIFFSCHNSEKKLTIILETNSIPRTNAFNYDSTVVWHSANVKGMKCEWREFTNRLSENRNTDYFYFFAGIKFPPESKVISFPPTITLYTMVPPILVTFDALETFFPG